MYTIYTIGHSTHPFDEFTQLLGLHGINCLIDVRSHPYSQYNPQFNKETLITELDWQGILYAHFGKEFGARHTRLSLLDKGGRVDFRKVHLTEAFKLGVKRLEEACEQGYQVGLMCSEGDPLDCHRFSMISYYVSKDGWEVIHILPDGDIITNEDLEQKMVEQLWNKLPQTNLFEQVTPEEQLEAAYEIIMKKVAYKPNISLPNNNEDDFR
jgi:uncharacterized protein (DUF488 family)